MCSDSLKSSWSKNYCMSRAGKYVVIASVILLASNEAITAHRTDLGVLLGLLLSLIWFSVSIFSAVLVFIDWRERRWRALLPLAACVFTMVIFGPLARLITPVVFAWSLPSYEAIVRQVESGAIPVSTEFSEIPQAQRQARLAQSVDAQKDADGVVRVIFWTESGFPALHSGYLYSSSGEPGAGMGAGWSIRETVRSNWFSISN